MPINIEYVPPKSLQAAPFNPRKIDEESLRRLAKLLDSHGFVDPVIARRQGTLLEARRRLGFARPASIATRAVLSANFGRAAASAAGVLIPKTTARSGSGDE